ncbi:MULTISPECIES: tryptophan halogenase family protein [Roseateles]|uniref:Tryptophan 7-halogenase n=1 Tax=Pelomonas caseinilytica TaxID=2906763 RepID=A0ABS8XPK4_9BURK|nr:MULTISPECIES: tryptophan halogenase family protein [unclassified Roseateles]MCE4539145.1 tryptophan 7-halogenase [Pelomonas sp. P7]HEV6965347.1 tryptophan halogenase family protein [Roseateles sp.]
MREIRRIVIVGGGTAGWMTAAALALRLLGKDGEARWSLQLIESDEIGIVGVGEATIPPIRNFNAFIGLDEDEFLRETGGSFKLGIEFVDWGERGERYMHAFGDVGRPLDALPFHQHWLRLGAPGSLADYSLNNQAALAGRFMRPRPEMAGSPLAGIAYAFHFDASRYAALLRRHAEAAGVQRTEGRIARVERDDGSGHIRRLVLQGGQVVDGDFFIDCSGLHALLIDKALGVPFEDWSHWLPCDRAWAVPTASCGPLLPFTRATAQESGWQWRIPLQHRTGNGHVFASAFVDEATARETLLSQLEGEALAEPRIIRFRTGRRREAWVGNCVAIGLSSGFLEPLESTSIHLIQSAILRLIELLPDTEFASANAAEYNRQFAAEMESVRDFIILHYKLTRRGDSPFWRHCRDMAVPESLWARMDLFAAAGHLDRRGQELFSEPSWLQVFVGQGLRPRGHHPLAELSARPRAQAFVDDVRTVVRRCVEVMPSHADFIAAHCAAP